MSKVLIFAVGFVAILGLSFLFPILPPGEILSNLLGISFDWSVFGVSGNTLIISVINGFFWGLLFVGFYALANHVSKREDLPPMPIQPYIPEPVPAKTEEKIPKKPLIIKRKTFVPLDQEIETIEGIGPTYGNRLRRKGIRVVEDLLRAGSTKKKRRDLSTELNVSSKTLLKWVYRADFFRLKGIGKQYSSLLESAGVNTVTNLSRRNPENLYLLLKETNKEKNLVKRIPHLGLIQNWVEDAKLLKTMVLS
jgi:predicted flap endonuclease-1-like 5' DNA nuclease